MVKRLLMLTTMFVLLTACGQSTDTSFGQPANQPHAHASDDAYAHTHEQATDTSTTATAGTLKPVLATSEIVVGPNRVALGLLENNVPIADATDTKVKVRYFKLNGNQATAAGEEEARYYGAGLGPRGTFIVHPTFDTAGTWGFEVEATRPGQAPTTQRLSVNVVPESSAPTIGEDAPQSKTPTVRDVADLTTITSDSQPEPKLYQMSVVEAVTSGKPSMILFATPGFCQTAVCGPGVDVLNKLSETFGDKVNAVHVEVYQLPYTGKVVPAMEEWGLPSEPWLFLVDENGKITGRYEGGITFEELEPDVAQLVG